MSLRPHQRFLQRGFLAYSRFTRGMTLGVRAMLFKGDDVLLVKHSYIPGWYFPGGGVEPGESVAEALTREIREEAGAAMNAPPELFGVYRNSHADRRDHLVLFLCRDFLWTPPRLPNGEIVAAELFSSKALPADISPGTQARIRELLNGAVRAPDW